MILRFLARKLTNGLWVRRPSRRTIILLSAKRSGSTAAFQVFRNHPDVGTCYKDPNVDNWEPNFWNFASRALDGDPHYFIERFKESHPFLKMPDVWTEDTISRLWDRILDVQGPIVFDKSPKYLMDPRALRLIGKYRDRGNDVRVLGLIRDPRDAISSQYELWHNLGSKWSPEERERIWLEMYANLEDMQRWFGEFPLFRYEDIAACPNRWVPRMLEWCGLRDVKRSYSHIKPVNVGRYCRSTNAAIQSWRIGEAMYAHMQKYGYV